MKHRILVVPQTDRNLSQLIAYMNNLGEQFEVLCLVFKGHCLRLWKNTPSLPSHWREVRFKWSDEVLPNKSIPILLWKCKRHNKYVEWLTELGVSLIVVGDDIRGMGAWTVQAARKAGIKTLVCQEGARWFYKFKWPWLYSLKVFILNHIKCKVSNVELVKEFNEADYAAVWGDYFKERVLSNGGKENKIFVVGNPMCHLDNISHTVLNSDNKKIVFFDIPIMNLNRGMVDVSTLLNFKLEVIKHMALYSSCIAYKTHPLVSPDEKKNMFEHLRRYDIKLIEEGSGEDVLKDTFIALSFPSTLIFSILANSIPLVLLSPKCKFIHKILWNPVALYGAGLELREPNETINVLKKFENKEFMSKYEKSAKQATEDVLGQAKLDTQQEFLVVVKKILNA